MSIDAKPFPPSGGGASVPDASETVKGVIEIADSTESAAGTDDLKAMTPLKVKQRIDAALVGGVDYKGSYTGQSLVTAQQGDMYISAATYSLAGVQFLSGDHLIFNQDASDPVTSAMFDKIDNTDAVSSVNTLTGAVVLSADDLAADHSASNYIPANANIDGHLSGIDDEFFLKAPKASPILTGTPTAPTATQGDNSSRIATTAYVDLAVSGAGNQINDIVSQTGSSFTAQRNYVYKCGYGLGTQTITMPDASGSTKGDLIGFTSDIQAYSIELVSSDGVTNDLKNINNQTKGGTNGALAITVDRQISWFICDANQWLEANAALSTLATTGAYSDLTGAPTIPADLNDLTDVVITGTPASGELLEVNGSNQFVNVAKSTINLSEFNDDLTYIGAVVEDTTPQLGGPLDVNGQAITSASNGDIAINPDGTGDISIGADMIPDADATHTIGDEDNRFISIYSDVNGALRFKAKNDEGAQITKGQVVYIKGLAGDGETPTVGLADADDASKMPAFGLAFNTANDQAEIQIVSVGNLYGLNTSAFSVGDTLYVDTTAGGLVNTKPTGETAQLQNIGRVIRSNNGAGVIMVGGAGRSAATPNLDDGKIFLGNASNQAVSTALSAINLTSFNDDLGLATVATTGAYSDLSGTPTLGTAAALDVGTSANNVVQLDGSARLPAVDGSQLTNLPSGATQLNDLSDVTITGASTGEVLRYSGAAWVDATLAYSDLSGTPTLATVATSGAYSDLSGTPTLATVATTGAYSDLSGTPTLGTAAALDVGTSASNVVQLDGSARLPAVDGSQLTNLPTASAASETVAGIIEIATNAEAGAGTATDKALVPSNVSSLSIGSGQVSGLATVATTGAYSDLSGTPTLATVATTGAYSDLSGTPTLGTAAALDVGTSASNVVQLDGSARLPAVDGSQLTNLPSGGGGWTYSAITADPANAQANYHYSCTGTFTITLPTTGMSAGQEIRIKNMGTGTITVDPQTSNIDGSTTDYVMDVQYGAITLVSTGTHWEII